jgi:trans-2,3-dihydro-3-hydroxyanthranilate isomerase
MRRYRFIQLDVFTAAPFGGNQLAVLPDATGLSDAEMQAIAREMNFSETTFVLPARDPKALRRVRIFTPATELPFAGHPVVGTTFALAYEGIAQAEGASPINLELGIGTLPVDLLFEDQRLSFVWMHQPTPTYQRYEGDAGRLAAALRLAPDDMLPELPIEVGSAGVPFLYVPLRSLDALGRAGGQPALAALAREIADNAGVYLFALERLGDGNGEARSRMFAPLMGIAEDPATGSAAGPFGVYLMRHGRVAADELGESRLRILQGVEMGRTSRLEVAITGSADAVRDVRVGGESVVVAEGELLLPDGPAA